MNQTTTQLTNKYVDRGILVDSNLLLLLVIGLLDRTLVPRFKRTCQFAQEDYDTLSNYLRLFSCRVTTPNNLTEVSNLARQIGKKRAEKMFSVVFPNFIGILDERYIDSRSVTQDDLFPKLGLTDTAILHLVRGKYLLLTDDLQLSGVYEKTGGDVVNFNHIRTYNWKL